VHCRVFEKVFWQRSSLCYPLHEGQCYMSIFMYFISSIEQIDRHGWTDDILRFPCWSLKKVAIELRSGSLWSCASRSLGMGWTDGLPWLFYAKNTNANYVHRSDLISMAFVEILLCLEIRAQSLSRRNRADGPGRLHDLSSAMTVRKVPSSI
jgi:hypothetical protein